MKIFVRRSGGIANIQIQGELETSELPSDLAQSVARWIKPSVLKQTGKKKPFMVDSQQISVGFQATAKSQYREYEIDESSANPELFDVCNELVNQLVRDRIHSARN